MKRSARSVWRLIGAFRWTRFPIFPAVLTRYGETTRKLRTISRPNRPHSRFVADIASSRPFFDSIVRKSVIFANRRLFPNINSGLYRPAEFSAYSVILRMMNRSSNRTLSCLFCVSEKTNIRYKITKIPNISIRRNDSYDLRNIVRL